MTCRKTSFTEGGLSSMEDNEVDSKLVKRVIHTGRALPPPDGHPLAWNSDLVTKCSWDGEDQIIVKYRETPTNFVGPMEIIAPKVLEVRRIKRARRLRR